MKPIMTLNGEKIIGEGPYKMQARKEVKMSNIEFLKKAMDEKRVLHVIIETIDENPDDEGCFADVRMVILEVSPYKTHLLTVEK